MLKIEEKLQISICKYLKIQYPNVYFMSDASGWKLPIGLAVKAKKQRSKHSQLDLIILESKGVYSGLILEIKKDLSEVYTKKNKFRNIEKVRNQNKSIKHLKDKGYYCTYVFSFEQAIEIIDAYLKFTQQN